MESSDRPYRFTEIEPARHTFDAEPVFLDRPRESELSTRRILLHIFLFIATIITTTIIGASWAVSMPEPTTFTEIFFSPITALVNDLAAGNYAPLLQGVIFSFTLLAILGAHEFGHYFACRYYGIRATLPFFIPAPPVAITLFGTFGAVIKIKEPIRSRRALFDIGIAGPLAGFALALPASIIGLVRAVPSPETGAGQINDPLLFKIIAHFVGAPPVWDWNPFYWAAWATLLVTALNLFPVGQLDGGHVVYAVLGQRVHKWVSRIVCIATAVFSITVKFWMDRQPVYLLWTLVLIFLLRVGHPPVIENEPLGKARIILAVVALLVFILCFLPFPMSV